MTSIRARVTTAPAGRSTGARKYLVMGGSADVGSPSGYQIQLAPSKVSASERSAPIHVADQSAGASRPISHHEGSLHSDGTPRSSHTRTFQR